MADFVYYNINPYGEREEDCVTRAIALASNSDYYDISDKLHLTGALLDCERLCVSCYKFLIEDVFKYKRVNCDNMTINDFAFYYPKGRYLVRMNGHISVLIDGTCYDIWDCRDLELTDAWKVK